MLYKGELLSLKNLDIPRGALKKKPLSANTILLEIFQRNDLENFAIEEDTKIGIISKKIGNLFSPGTTPTTALPVTPKKEKVVQAYTPTASTAQVLNKASSPSPSSPPPDETIKLWLHPTKDEIFAAMSKTVRVTFYFKSSAVRKGNWTRAKKRATSTVKD